MSLLLGDPDKRLTATQVAVVPSEDAPPPNPGHQAFAELLAASSLALIPSSGDQSSNGGGDQNTERQEGDPLTIKEIIELCREYENSGFKMSQRQFSKKKGIYRSNFDRYWRLYKSGKLNNVLQPEKRHRLRNGKYMAVENMLIEYVKLTANEHGKPEFSWGMLSRKALEIARLVLSPEEASSFKASPGWLYRILSRHGIIQCEPRHNEKKKKNLSVISVDNLGDSMSSANAVAQMDHQSMEINQQIFQI
jgi:hypothetical protein